MVKSDTYDYDFMNAIADNKVEIREMLKNVCSGESDRSGWNAYGELQVRFVRDEDSVEVFLYINYLTSFLDGTVGSVEDGVLARNEVNDEIVSIVCDIVNPVYEVGDVEFVYQNSGSGQKIFRMDTEIRCTQ